MNPTISTVQNFLKTVSFQPGGKILAAVSGGADSIAMLHILCRLAAAEGGEPFVIPAKAGIQQCNTTDSGGRKIPSPQSSIDNHQLSIQKTEKTGDSHLFPDTLTAASASEPISQSSIINYQFQLLCAHINHQLRDKDSDADEQFTAELCKKLNIPFFAERIDVKAYAAQKKLSIETAARQLRLAALVRIARRTGCQYIATAHHKDDQAETVLFRLLRGTAFPGLTGIRPIIERAGLQWIRPMLHLRRTDIESYCRQNNLSWRDDASNLQTHFRRNWIRHRLLPAMQQSSESDLTETLAALAQSALSLQQQVEKSANNILHKSSTSGRVGPWPTESSQISNLKSQIPSPDCPPENSQSSIDNHQSTILNRDSYLLLENLSVIKESGPFVAGEILRTVLNHLSCGLRDISLSHYQQFFRLLNNPRAVLELPGGCTIRKKNDTLTFETADTLPDVQMNPPVEIPLEGTTQFANWRIQTRLIRITQNDLESFQKQRDNSRQWFDRKQIQSPIVVRCRQKDDSFIPFGRKTPKKIARFLADSQIDPKQKESCFVIEDKTGILWLAPLRRSARAAVAADTFDVLEIRIVPSSAKI